MNKFHKIKTVLLAAALSAMVFAQSEEGKGPKLRFSGDVLINSAFETSKDSEYENKQEDGKTVEGEKKEVEGSKAKAFNTQYGWNAAFGVDFNDAFSVDFRLSNPSGYGLDMLNFKNGSGIWESLPMLPNAYFTWKPGMFSLKGGLLEVSGNTTLDLVAGAESEEGLWTYYWGWDAQYNASQGGLQLGFELSEGLALNLTAAMVSPTNELDAKTIYNEFRFILDADIALGDMISLKPVFQSRSYWQQGSYTEEKDGKDTTYETTPILLSYGADVGIALSEEFNLDIGIAGGNATYEKSKGKDSESKTSGTAFLAKVAPSLTLGIVEIEAQYSFGLLNMPKNKSKTGSVEEATKNTTIYHDIYLGAFFRVNDNFAFGPMFNMPMSTDKTSSKVTGGTDAQNKDDKYRTDAWSAMRAGLEFSASF
ncbi:MAG: hypothetical protein FWF51_00505 [Chitinivibrionia bacterium]|nr:hypothetical protein [Chitinivibrionia bacterium]